MSFKDHAIEQGKLLCEKAFKDKGSSPLNFLTELPPPIAGNYSHRDFMIANPQIRALTRSEYMGWVTKGWRERRKDLCLIDTCVWCSAKFNRETNLDSKINAPTCVNCEKEIGVDLPHDFEVWYEVSDLQELNKLYAQTVDTVAHMERLAELHGFILKDGKFHVGK